MSTKNIGNTILDALENAIKSSDDERTTAAEGLCILSQVMARYIEAVVEAHEYDTALNGIFKFIKHELIRLQEIRAKESSKL